MRVLAVAKRRLAAKCQVHAGWKFARDGFSTHEIRNRPIVNRCVIKRVRRQLLTQLQRRSIKRIQLCQNFAVLFGAGRNRNVQVVLGRSPNQTGATDINLLDTLVA